MLFKKILKIKVQAAKFSSRVCFLSSSCVVGGPAFFPPTVFSSCLFWSESSTGACRGPGPLSEAKFVFPAKGWSSLSFPSGSRQRSEAHAVRCQGKCPVYSPHGRKDAVEALPAVISLWLRVPARLEGLPRVWEAGLAGRPGSGCVWRWGPECCLGQDACALLGRCPPSWLSPLTKYEERRGPPGGVRDSLLLSLQNRQPVALSCKLLSDQSPPGPPMIEAGSSVEIHFIL